MAEDVQPIGQVLHYFDRIGVAIIHLWEDLALGDWVHFYGSVTNFVQPIESLQIDQQDLEAVQADQEHEVDIAVQAVGPVTAGDWVYVYYPEDNYYDG